MTEWLNLQHDETGGTARVPAAEGVQEWYESRGWRVVDAPAEAPFVPAPDGGQVVPAGGYGSDAGWVDLGHPDTGAVHRFPGNAEALQGAHEAGWTALNKDGSVPKRQKPLTAALDAPVDPEPAPTEVPPEIPDAAPAPEKPKNSAASSTTGSATTTKEQ